MTAASVGTSGGRARDRRGRGRAPPGGSGAGGCFPRAGAGAPPARPGAGLRRRESGRARGARPGGWTQERERPPRSGSTSSSRCGFRRWVGTAQRTARAAEAPSERSARATSSAVQGRVSFPSDQPGRYEGHAGGSIGKLDLHGGDAGPERALDLLAAADQLEDVQERGSLQLPALRGAGDPNPTRAEQCSERGGLTARCALEQGRAVVQLQRRARARCAEAEAERGDRTRRSEARRMAERAEALTDRAPARRGDGGLLEVAEELLAHPDHGLAPLGPVEPDPADETGRPGERRDAQGAAVLGVLQAEHEPGLGQRDVGHRRCRGRGRRCSRAATRPGGGAARPRRRRPGRPRPAPGTPNRAERCRARGSSVGRSGCGACESGGVCGTARWRPASQLGGRSLDARTRRQRTLLLLRAGRGGGRPALLTRRGKHLRSCVEIAVDGLDREVRTLERQVERHRRLSDLLLTSRC